MSKIFLWCDCSYTRVGLQSLLYNRLHNDCSVMIYDEENAEYIGDVSCFIFVVSSDNFFKVANFLKENELRKDNNDILIISPNKISGFFSRVCHVSRTISLQASLSEMASSLRAEVTDKLNSYSEVTKKELQVMDMLMSGQTVKEVALHLDKSIKTISTHKKNFLIKLGIKNNLVMLKNCLGK